MSQERDFRIFNYIDEERKYYGFTAMEIGTAVILLFGGFIMNAMIIATFGSFVSVFVIRYVKALLKASSLVRRSYFIVCDFLALKDKGTNVYARHYL